MNTHVRTSDILTGQIIKTAIEVHRRIGPGLLESIYEVCLAYELEKVGLEVERQKVIPLQYDELTFETAFRIDLLVSSSTVVEIKAVSEIAEIHKAQLLSYLRLGGYPVGLLINFNVPVLKDGLWRMSN